MPWKLSVTAFMSGLGSLSKKRENREIARGLLKCFLLLQTVFLAVCNMGIEKSVADRANTPSEAEQKRGRKRKHHQKRMKTINPERRKPKGINLKAGESRGGMTPPPTASSCRGVEGRKVVIILWC